MQIGLSFSGFPPEFVNKAFQSLRETFPGHQFVQGGDITVVYDPKIKEQFPTPSVARNFIFSTNPPKGQIVFAYNDPFYAPDIVHELEEYLVWHGYDCLSPAYAVSLAREGGKTYVDSPDNTYYIILKSGGELRGSEESLKNCLLFLKPDEIASTNLITTPEAEKPPEEAPSWFEQFVSGITPPAPQEKEEEEIKPITGEISLWTPSVSFPSLSTLPAPAYKATPSPGVAPILGIALLILLGIALYATRS
jgi:hypothetical protein